jgi:hypothetical protein
MGETFVKGLLIKKALAAGRYSAAAERSGLRESV